MKKLLSWPALAVEAFILVVVCWPWANHWVSYFWLLVVASVLISELLNKLFSPKKQTVSENVQDEAKSDPVRFWIMIFVWIVFAFTLAGHFMLKLF